MSLLKKLAGLAVGAAAVGAVAYGRRKKEKSILFADLSFIGKSIVLSVRSIKSPCLKPFSK